MLFNTFLIAATFSIGAVHCATPTANDDNHWTSGLLQRRHAIIGRLRERVSRSHLSRRASAPACPFARDNEGNCCPNNALERDGDCCLADNYYTPQCSSSACCQGGQVYRTLPFFNTPDSCCRSPSTVYRNANGNEACCPSGVVAGTTCCTAGQFANGGVCQSGPAKKRVKRNADSSSVMVQRRDQSRMLLSPDLVAEHLLNNGVFEHEGEKYVDHNHQAHNDGFLRRLAGKGMYQAMKYVFKPGRVYDADRWNSVEFIPISEAYEFAVKDVPEIYARIVAKEDFDVFHWSGAAFDRDILYRLASGHPTFNESLVNLYR